MYADSHCHLNYFSEEKIFKIIEEALHNEVSLMLSIGTTCGDALQLIKIANKYPGKIYITLGVHPDNISDLSDEDFSNHFFSINEKCVVGVGEIGIDYHSKAITTKIKNEQISAFEKQIFIAKENNLPIVIHSRDGMKDTIETVKFCNHNSGVFHCYTGNISDAKKILDLGFLISFSGIITFKNANEMRDVLKYLPNDKILIETDSPYLSPTPFRGQENSPKNIKFIAEEIAKLKAIKIEEVAKTTKDNTLNLFKIK